MLWSLLKMVLFFCIVAALAIGAGQILDLDGGITIQIANWQELNLTPFRALILLLVVLFGFWVLLKLAGFLVALLKFLNGDETAISRYFDRNREKRGYQALNEALVALASGDGREALRGANRAERLLHKPELTNLVAAQAAELSGDHARAETVYKNLLSDDSTRFVGVRGIMKQRLAAGDKETALKLAEKAFGLKPKHSEIQDTLLKLQAEKSDWGGARKTLAAKLSTGTMPRDIHKRRDAVLAMAEGQEALANGNMAKARDEFMEANRLSPDFVPAAVAAARSYIERDQARVATRVIKKAWAVTPHPDLAAAFAEIAPNETPTARIARFQNLIKVHPDDPETKMMLAELYIAAEDFPAARRALGSLAEDVPTVRALTIMAAIERGEGSDDAVVRGWLTRALSASRGPQWICDVCNTVAAVWVPICEVCGGFDTLSWRAAPEPEVSAPASTGMLPLIVGAPSRSASDGKLPVEAKVIAADANSGR